MSDSMESQPQGRPWHLWVLGILCLLVSGMGAFDWIMTVSRNEAYLAQVPQETLDYYFGFPVWMFALWAVGNFGGLVGAVLLLLKKRVSVWVLAVSVTAGILATIYTYAFRGGLEMTGTGGLIAGIVILTFSTLVVFYARRMAAKGVLT